MTAADALEKALPLFESYYSVTRDGVPEPFAAEAVFSAQDRNYAVFRMVKISEADSKEYIFFALADRLTAEEIRRLDEAAWTEGLRRVQPGPSHRNTDIALIVLADSVDPDAASYVKKLRRHKSYKHMLHGWSNYRAVVTETSTGNVTCNRLGQNYRKLFSNINLQE